MKKTAILFLLIIVLGMSLMVGCANSTSEFVGTWILTSGETNTESITFYSDGSCFVDDEEIGEWTVVDGTLKILGPYFGEFMDHNYIVGQYSIKGKTLTITNARIDGEYNDTLIYDKVN